MTQSIFTDSAIHHEFGVLCRSLPWIFSHEGKIFEAFDLPHSVLRIPWFGSIVVREEKRGAGYLHLRELIVKTKAQLGDEVVQQLFSLVSRKREVNRACQKGGAAVFRSLSDHPSDLQTSDLISIFEILQSGEIGYTIEEGSIFDDHIEAYRSSY